MQFCPKKEDIKNNLLKEFCKKYLKIDSDNYSDIHNYSINNLEAFWKSVWHFCKIKGDIGSAICENLTDVEKAIFFKDAKLNFAQNLLNNRTNNKAITFFNELNEQKSITYNELYLSVAKISAFFKKNNITKGDIVAGYVPNITETVQAMLGITSLGGVWTACSTDFGIQGVIDRFLQINPKILIVTDGYYYNGKSYCLIEKIPQILEKITSIKKVIIIPYVGFDIEHNYENWLDIFKNQTETEIDFVKVGFNDPLYILYSSGTTGIPKCIVHGVGGTLIQHLKEHQLQCNIKANDSVFYYTTCAWMMWHWLVSALASDAHIILFDGSPTYPNHSFLWQKAQELNVSFFGTSAKYLSVLQKNEVSIKKDFSLDKLKTIGSTGSPLAYETFDYIWSNIKQEVQISSLSGGTDIISCFVMGNPFDNVNSGEIQGKGLGMSVEVFNEKAETLLDISGELVCTKPFPSRPIYFFNDNNFIKYHDTYYSKFNNVWYHGDYCKINSKTNGIVIEGRSDATLNPNGVRIGSAELYRQIEKLDFVKESMAVGQNFENDERILLFVSLIDGVKLNDELKKTIIKQIVSNTTNRHAPALIFQVENIIKTKNNKLSEIAVKDIMNGRTVKNTQSLQDESFLDEYYKIYKRNFT